MAAIGKLGFGIGYSSTNMLRFKLLTWLSLNYVLPDVPYFTTTGVNITFLGHGIPIHL